LQQETQPRKWLGILRRGKANKMKISLISTDTVMICYGLRSISSALRQADHETQLFYMLSRIQEEPRFAERTLDQLGQMVKDSDVIGVSCMAYTSDRCKQMIQHLKKFDIPIVWGGINATLDPEECLEYADIVCVGEGEGAMLELVSHLQKGADWKHIPNLAFRENGKVVKNEVRPLVQDLDSLPFPDYDGEHHYILQDQVIVPSDKYDYSRRDFNIWYLLHTARGCVQSCSYCCNSRLRKLYLGKGRIVRKRSIEHCIREVEYVQSVLPGREKLWITDDSFLVRSVDELEEFAEKFKSRIGIPYRCNGTPNTITKEKLAPLVATGLFEVRVGIQTGSERIAKDIYKRPIKNSSIKAAAEALNAFKDKLNTAYQLIITNPYEEEEDVLATINLIRELPPPFELVIFNLVFFPGSELYEHAVKDGIISGRGDSCYHLDFHESQQSLHLELKNKNVYLNSLLYLMRGFARKNRIGSIPRGLFPILLNNKVVSLIDSFPALNKLNTWFFDIVRKAYILYRKRIPASSAGGAQ